MVTFHKKPVKKIWSQEITYDSPATFYIYGKCTGYANEWTSRAKNETGAKSIAFAWEQTLLISESKEELKADAEAWYSNLICP